MDYDQTKALFIKVSNLSAKTPEFSVMQLVKIFRYYSLWACALFLM